MVNLLGRTVFIPGGCGIVGSGITRKLLQHGAKVAVASRSQERLDGLRKSLDKIYQQNLLPIKEDVSTEAGASKALEILDKQGEVQHVVASIGSFWQGGPLTKQSTEEFDRVLSDRARSHFICARTFLPYLENIDESTYTFISGAGADDSVIPDVSMLVVSGACMQGIAAAARSEFTHSKVAVNEVNIGLIIMPKLDKDLDQKTVAFGNEQLDAIGYDVFGDVILNVIQSRAKGIMRIKQRKDLEETTTQLQQMFLKC